MSTLFEIHYPEPMNPEREQGVARAMAHFGGNLTFREEPDGTSPLRAVVLTFEFESRANAERAAEEAARLGECVRGFSDC